MDNARFDGQSNGARCQTFSVTVSEAGFFAPAEGDPAPYGSPVFYLRDLPETRFGKPAVVVSACITTVAIAQRSGGPEGCEI
ncbi:unnamed protein product [Heligmosomoides polygyrus]|uniref:ZP domain-containing protein n=1 Tax=Heligmosomoides polygyrus TaxID=6339 RepID=A0A183FP81_HELPZ|nr:unnamed protein product [Heligmosomoides polygyrus]